MNYAYNILKVDGKIILKPSKEVRDGVPKNGKTVWLVNSLKPLPFSWLRIQSRSLGIIWECWLLRYLLLIMVCLIRSLMMKHWGPECGTEWSSPPKYAIDHLGTRMNFAQSCVKVYINDELPKANGNYAEVIVEYPWKPQQCCLCKLLPKTEKSSKEQGQSRD